MADNENETRIVRGAPQKIVRAVPGSQGKELRDDIINYTPENENAEDWLSPDVADGVEDGPPSGYGQWLSGRDGTHGTNVRRTSNETNDFDRRLAEMLEEEEGEFERLRARADELAPRQAAPAEMLGEGRRELERLNAIYAAQEDHAAQDSDETRIYVHSGFSDVIRHSFSRPIPGTIREAIFPQSEPTFRGNIEDLPPEFSGMRPDGEARDRVHHRPIRIVSMPESEEDKDSVVDAVYEKKPKTRFDLIVLTDDVEII